MPKAKKKLEKGKEIGNFIRESGFIFELEVADILEKSGYQVSPSEYFFDAEEGKRREIDLIATKNIGGVTVCLVVECKQHLGGDWVFISTQKSPTRYFAELKHSPPIPVKVISENPPYDNLHIYNVGFPVAQSYLIYESKKGRNAKQDPIQIKECLYKLPKALVWTARNKAEVPTIYLPVAFFSGNIFVANYQNKLVVKEKLLVQVQADLETPAYYDKPVNINRLNSIATTPASKIESDPDMEKAKASAKRLGKQYAVDFVPKKGIKRFLSLIEREVKLLDLSKWPVPTAVKP